MTESYTVSDLVAEFLSRIGVSTAFGIASVHNIPLLDAFSRRRGLHFVMTRGEMGASHMADGYARASGALGLLITSTGPAAANACSGLLEAFCANTPLLHITGQTATAHAQRGRGTTHDIPMQTEMLKGVCKSVYYIRAPEEIFGVLRRAVAEALSVPRGPVSIEIPIDIQRAQVRRPDGIEHASLHVPTPDAPDEAALETLVTRVMKARRPMLWVGAGARSAYAEVQGLLERGFGLVTSWSGRGVVPETHPQTLGALHGIGAPAVEEFYRGVDLMIIAGSRVRGQETLESKLKLPEHRVQIDIDPQAEGRTYGSELFVQGDAKAALGALLEGLRRAGWRAEAEFPAQFAAVKATAQAAFAKTLGPYEHFPAQLRAAVPEDAIFARDITVANSTWGHRLFPISEPGQNVFPVGCGIGQGLPLALGAAVAAKPGQKTILLSGDGGFALNLGEVWTAVQDNLDVLMIVMNDGGYAVIKHIQDAQCAGNRQYGDLLAPDFGKLAASAGMPFWQVNEAGEFPAKIAEAMKVKGPALVEVNMHKVGAHPPYFPYSEMSKPA